MKKLLSMLLVLATMLTLLVSCKGETQNSDTATSADAGTDETTDLPLELSKDPVRIFTLKGPTGMGMAPLMDATEKKTAQLNYQFTVANSADEFVGHIAQGNFEIACVPTNLAAVLNKKTNGAIQVAAVNTLGVLYILENGNTINSVADLEGKTIYSAGQGAVPEYALKYILDTLGINCTVKYESDHDVVSSLLLSGTADVVLLPEPKVTATLKSEKAPDGIRIALDLNDLWDQACDTNGDESTLYMGCIIVNKKWAKDNKDEYGTFLIEYYESVNTVNSQPDIASEMIAAHGIIPKAPLAKAAIPNSNIVFITGEQMKKGLTGFYKILYKYNPESIKAIPGDEFFA